MIRNCLGITLEDLKRDLFDKLDSFLLGWLLNRDCNGGSDGAAALANFDAYNFFVAKKSLDYLNNADRNNSHLSGGDLFGFLRDIMPNLLKDFAHRECNGQNNAIKDEIYKYKPNPYTNMYPNSITDSQKQGLLDILRDTNFQAAVLNGASVRGPNDIDSYLGNGGGGKVNGDATGAGTNTTGSTVNQTRAASPGILTNPYLVINENDVATGDLTDATDNIFGDSILKRIPVAKIEAFDIDKATYTKCFKTRFDLDMFLVPEVASSKAVLTPGKVANVRRIFSEILMPIYRYYYGDEPDNSCKMRLHGGITTIKTAYMLLGSSLATKHVSGEAVNFSLVSISNEQIIRDVRDKKIKLDFGVIANVNGVYITLPTTFENYEVRGLVLSSPTFDADNIKVDFT